MRRALLCRAWTDRLSKAAKDLFLFAIRFLEVKRTCKDTTQNLLLTKVDPIRAGTLDERPGVLFVRLDCEESLCSVAPPPEEPVRAVGIYIFANVQRVLFSCHGHFKRKKWLRLFMGLVWFNRR